MGHHISKLQSQQVSDDQQVTNSVERNTKVSSTVKCLQVKNRKIRPIAGKKSKKFLNNGDTSTPIQPIKLQPSDTVSNQERSAGSVIITIRLLKMESAKSIDANGNDNLMVQQCDSEIGSENSNLNGSTTNGWNRTICGSNCTSNGGIMINSFLNNGQNSINDVNAALLSETIICDKKHLNCTSQTGTLTAMNCTTHPLHTIKLTESSNANDAKAKHIRDTFIPTNLTGPISPYPHHIPIANIIRTDRLNTANDEPSSSTQSTGVEHSGGISEQSVNQTISVSGQQPTTLLFDKSTLFSSGGNVIVVTMDQQEQAWITPDEYSIDDCDKKARLQRAIEIAEGVEPPPGFITTSSLQSLNSVSASNGDPNAKNAATKPPMNVSHWMLCSNAPAIRIIVPSLMQLTDNFSRIHSQEGYIHCLVPDLKQITSSSFYWGKMDRYEAERLLENKPEGTFLLRDSAQEEFLFSVSFRKYGRSLHARIEQFNHKFSFDCRDPGVYTSITVTGLLEHYKDPACVMFFEPALTLPLHRKTVFTLQQLCRATIVSHTTYDGINEMCLPKTLKAYLKEYHYKQRVRVRRFDESNYIIT